MSCEKSKVTAARIGRLSVLFEMSYPYLPGELVVHSRFVDVSGVCCSVLRCMYVGVGVFGLDMGSVVCVIVCIMWVGVWSVSVV